MGLPKRSIAAGRTLVKLYAVLAACPSDGVVVTTILLASAQPVSA